MKRLHVHLKVEDLEGSVAFYSRLFGAGPSRREADYAKWSLAEPAVNFAISESKGVAGIEHLGIEMDGTPSVRETADRVNGASRVDEEGASCCYVVSDKSWLTDPDGIVWELFHSRGSLPAYGGDIGHSRVCCAG